MAYRGEEACMAYRGEEAYMAYRGEEAYMAYRGQEACMAYREEAACSGSVIWGQSRPHTALYCLTLPRPASYLLPRETRWGIFLYPPLARSNSTVLPCTPLYCPSPTCTCQVYVLHRAALTHVM